MALLSTQSSKMPLLLLLLLLLLCALTAAQPRCDPLTQYVKDGQCCAMCPSGTSMTSYGSCLEPHCKECDTSEYQEKWTSESKCERQPYCDPNINFETPVHNRKERTVCKCKVGFHCSSPQDCSFCRPHSACQPGYEANPAGDHLRDTVCKKCPEGSFSNETSWDSVCVKWTKCGDGSRVLQRGTDTSDNVCEQILRTHIIVIGVLIAIFFLCAALAGVWFWRGRRGDVEGQVKCCVESCLRDKNEPVKLLTVTPTDPEDEESVLNEVRSQQDEGLRSPEESDEPSLEASSSDFQSRLPECYTENGKFVAQENGATEKLSRQESQTQAFTD